MTPKELVDILTEEDKLEGLKDAQMADINVVQNAIVRALPQDELRFLLKGVEDNQYLRHRLGELRLSKLRWMTENPSGSKKDVHHRNETLSSLLKLFSDKRSGRVEYSRKELQRRYPYQSYADQKRILKQMFSGSKADRMWACRRLSQDRMPGFEDELRHEWESRHELSIAYIALRRLPSEYMLSQIEELSDAGVDIWEICSRLGNEPGFPYQITPELVSPERYIQTMAKLGRSVPEDVCRQIIHQVLVSHCGKIIAISQEEYVFAGIGHGLVKFSFFNEMVWALGKLGHVDLLKQLLELFSAVAAQKPDDLREVSRVVLKQLEGGDALSEHQDAESCDKVEFLYDSELPDAVKDFVRDFGADDKDITVLSIRKNENDSIC